MSPEEQLAESELVRRQAAFELRNFLGSGSGDLNRIIRLLEKGVK